MFKDFVTTVANEEFNKVWNQKKALVTQAAQSDTGEAEITKMNSDGTVDVKHKGTVFKSVAPPSNPPKVGNTVMLLGGKKVL